MKTSTITRLTGVSRATLHNWKTHKPKLYEVVQLGCEVKLNQETELSKTIEQHKTIETQ